MNHDWVATIIALAAFGLALAAFSMALVVLIGEGCHHG
jgi:uncharacterized membrane protein YidH (DUF202 family)